MTESNRFNSVIERDQVAARHFTSAEFFDVLKAAVDKKIIREGKSFATITSQYAGMAMKQRDLPYIQETFRKLQEIYPALNHVRIGIGGDLCLDTKENGFLRRAITSEFSFGANCYAPDIKPNKKLQDVGLRKANEEIERTKNNSLSNLQL
jgi:hypothetical protein